MAGAVSERERAAAMAAQEAMQRWVPALEIDGWWGSYTHGVYMSLTPQQHMEIDEILARNGVTAGRLRVAYQAEKMRNPSAKAEARGMRSSDKSKWLSMSQLEPVLARAATEFQVDYDVLRKFLELEAERGVRDGVRVYNPWSVSPNGMYKGLFQMGSAAWDDSAEEANRLGIKLPKFGDWADPEANTRAAAAYIRVNFRLLKAKGYTGPLTAEVAYGAHNQGAAGLLRAMRTGQVAGKQSAAAVEVIKTAAAQNGYRWA